jgi:hypothetical protein
MLLGNWSYAIRVFGICVAKSNVAVGVAQAALEELGLSLIQTIKNPATAIDMAKSNQDILAMVRHVVIEFTMETISENERLQTGRILFSEEGSTVTIQVDVQFGLLQHTKVLGEHKCDGSEKSHSVGSALSESLVVVSKTGRMLVKALETVGSNNVVGQGLKSGDDVITAGIVTDCLSAPVLSEDIVKHNGEASVELIE